MQVLIDSEGFLALLPELLIRDKTRAIFVTYNEVGVYQNGEVETGIPNLSIRVQNGSLEYSPLAHATAGLVPSYKSLRAFEVVDAVQRATVEQSTEEKISEDVQLMAFIYTGLVGFRPTAEYVKAFRRDHPDAIIVLTMCDCGLSKHRVKIEELIQSKAADHVVMRRECGGNRLMRDLLRGLIEKHKEKVPQAV